MHLTALAKPGSVVGIVFLKLALYCETVRNFINVIRYTVNLVGVDDVGGGSDCDDLVARLCDSSGLAPLTEEVLDEGCIHAEIARLMGRNTLRLLKKNLLTDSP